MNVAWNTLAQIWDYHVMDSSVFTMYTAFCSYRSVMVSLRTCVQTWTSSSFYCTVFPFSVISPFPRFCEFLLYYWASISVSFLQCRPCLICLLAIGGAFLQLTLLPFSLCLLLVCLAYCWQSFLSSELVPLLHSLDSSFDSQLCRCLSSLVWGRRLFSLKCE